MRTSSLTVTGWPVLPVSARPWLALEAFAMPRALPVPIRRAVFRRWQQGQPAAAIAHALDLAPRSVRRLLRRFAQQGTAGVPPGYDRCGPKRPTAPAELVQAALTLRREHARWGAGLIRGLLRRSHPGVPLPAERTL